MNPLPPAPTRKRYWMLGWLCSLSMITYIDRVCIKNVRGDMQFDLGISVIAHGISPFGASSQRRLQGQKLLEEIDVEGGQEYRVQGADDKLFLADSDDPHVRGASGP